MKKQAGLISINIIICLLLCNAVAHKQTVNERVEEFQQELRKSRLGTSHTQRLQELINEYSLPDSLRGVPPEELPEPYDDTLCVVCKTTIKQVVAQYDGPESREKVRDMVIKLCELLKIETDEVCTGIVDVHLDLALYLAEHIETEWLTEGLCGLFINSGDCLFEEQGWTVDVDLGTKPDIITPNIPDNPAETLTIVHFTDPHLDRKYLAGGNTDCGEPLCCRVDQGNASDVTKEAGYWGDYRNCDAPTNTILNTMQQILDTTQDIDYIYITGDYVEHGVWETSQETNAETITKLVQSAKDTFKDIPIVFTLGNHEPHPVNQYSPPDIDNDNVTQKWLYELVADLWSPYITEEAKETILQGGFYTLKLQEGFRVIVLNNVIAHNADFWNVYNLTDPFGQLKWLAQTLLQAEKDGEKVHILYHIPTHSCLKTWSREYHKIIDRFENIISGQFNGHSHHDEFQVFYSIDNATRANGVLYNGGSVTPASNINPNYKVYKVDPQSMYVYEVESWIFNLTSANIKPSENPQWYKQYTFREDYGVKSLSPTDLDQLTHHMAEDHELLQKHFRYFFKSGDPMLAQGCDDNCLKDKLCVIVNTQNGVETQCDVLREEYDAKIKQKNLQHNNKNKVL